MSKSNKNISAKDKAFEKERIKFRKQIRELEQDLHTKDIEIMHLKNEAHDKDDEIKELKYKIIEISKLIGCSEEEIKIITQLNNTMSKFKSMFDILGGRYI